MPIVPIAEVLKVNSKHLLVELRRDSYSGLPPSVLLTLFHALPVEIQAQHRVIQNGRYSDGPANRMEGGVPRTGV